MGEAKRRQAGGAPTGQGRGGKRTGWMIAGGAIALALVAGVVWLSQPPAAESPSLPVAAADAGPFPAELDQYGVSIGPADAPVVVREFADYQCPACANFAEASQKLKAEFVASGQVRFVYFDLPLRQHANAIPAAMAARCAGDQDQYWPMHERLFARQSAWSDSESAAEIFTRYAGDLGLDQSRFRRCMATDLHREAIENSAAVARQLRVMSTPTVMVDNIPLTRPGWGQLSAVVERELAR